MIHIDFNPVNNNYSDRLIHIVISQIGDRRELLGTLPDHQRPQPFFFCHFRFLPTL